MIIDLLPDPPSSYVVNCILEPKPGEDMWGGVFISQDGVVIARLNGYAIIPAEEYKDLLASNKKA